MINYTVTSNENITNFKISDGAYRLYMLLQSMCYGEKISCYPSEKYMAVALGRSVRTIQRYLKQLKTFGFISIRRRGSISNLITILQKKTAQTMQKVKDTINNARKAYTSHKTYAETKNDTFNNYNQRNYKFDRLEDLLLHGKGNYKDCLIE